MKLGHLYNQVVKFGRDRDPRKDKGNITSYADTAVLYGNLETEVKKVMIGIDIEVAELLLADRIRQRQGLDLVIAHHPEGRAFARLHDVMRLQIDLLKDAGISAAVAKKLLGERMIEVERRILPQNHTRPVDAARLLDMPFMCMHTPADNHVYRFIEKLMDDKKPRKVKDVVDILSEVPEYKEASKINAGPSIIIGNPNRPVGKILIEMTGGTEGSKDVFEKLYKTGVRTLISMHLSEEHFKKVKDANLNAVIAGHISSDTLGLNLLLDRLENEEPFQIINSSGFYRIKRN
ncbi:MAG: NGG1p interacting factor NIF3 [Candidatus Omnitrophica bacterium]|nr:NGG1p interacting factor NIF3 [Candidatus Omnitrophota bacterium]